MTAQSAHEAAPEGVTQGIAKFVASLDAYFQRRGVGFTATGQISAATSVHDDVWTAGLDPNKRMFVGSAVKTFILAQYLLQDPTRELRDIIQIDDSVRSISSPVFGGTGVTLDGATSAGVVLEAMIAHSDNTATDAALKAVGVDAVRRLIADAGLSTVRIPDSTRRLFTWLSARRDEEVSWPQLVDYYVTEPDPQPPINGRQSMLASAADMVRWYQLALLEPGFLDDKALAQFKRISSMADGNWRVVPGNVAAFGKGGSIQWIDFGCVSLSATMMVPTRDPSLPGWMPVTFSFEINWGAGDDRTFHRVAGIFQRTLSTILQEAVNSFYWTTANHALTAEADVIVGTAGRDAFSGPGGGADELKGGGGIDSFEIAAGQTGRIDGGADSDTVRALDAALDPGLVLRNVETLEATTASLAATVAQLAQFERLVPLAGGAAFTLLLQGDGGRLDLSQRYASSVPLSVDAAATTARVELVGTERGDDLAGSAFDDVLLGGGGDDTLAGGAGFDTASFAGAAGRMRVDLAAGTALGEGRDALSGIEAVIGSAQDDSLRGDDAGNALLGAAGDDRLWGRAGDDRLFGDAGADVLSGGLGADRLTGGAGPDTFVFVDLADSTVAGQGRDRITDFDEAAGDRIDLRGIDAVAGLAGDQAFTFVGSAGFSGVAGELRASLVGATLLLTGDVDGDRAGDFAIALDRAPALTAAGLLL